MLKIIKAEYLSDYKLKVWFNNQQVRIVDLESSLCGEVFVPLRDKSYFKEFTIPFNTVQWDNGADFAPEYLYSISIPTSNQ